MVIDEINTIDFDIPWLFHRACLHYSLAKNAAAPMALFGGRKVYATGDIFQLACALPNHHCSPRWRNPPQPARA
jgi:hypothetical protein